MEIWKIKNGYPCKGSKGEREFKKYLDDEVNEWKQRKKFF